MEYKSDKTSLTDKERMFYNLPATYSHQAGKEEPTEYRAPYRKKPGMTPPEKGKSQRGFPG
jgi:hypothetical protein